MKTCHPYQKAHIQPLETLALSRYWANENGFHGDQVIVNHVNVIGPYLSFIYNAHCKTLTLITPVSNLTALVLQIFRLVISDPFEELIFELRSRGSPTHT